MHNEEKIIDGKIMIYSYVARDYVEYEPPIDYDAYDEYEDQVYFI